MDIDKRSAKAQAKADKAYKKANRPFYKKKRTWIAGVAGLLVIGGVAGGCSATQGNSPESTPSSAPTSTSQESVESKSNDVPREHTEALEAANAYISSMGVSEQGLHDQMTSEYGNQFSPEATEYALNSVEVDWNSEAKEAAEAYLDAMPFSKKELFDQLTSPHGDQFTKEQAQYAVDAVM